MDSLLERHGDGGYYQGGKVVLKDAEVAVSLAGTGEKISSSLLEIPRGMMEESFASSAGSEHYLPRLISPKAGSALPPEKSPPKAKSETSHHHNKTISRLLNSVSPEVKAQLEKATPAVPQHSDVVVGRTAGNGWHSRKPPHSRLSSSFSKPTATPERMGVTGIQWVYTGAAGESVRPRTAAAFRYPLIEAPSAPINQRRTSTGTDLDALADSFTPQLLKPRYLVKSGATLRPEPKVVDVKIPTPKFRAATVLITPQEGESPGDRRRGTTMGGLTPQSPVTEWSIRITPKAGEKSKEPENPRRETSDISAKGSIDRITPEEMLPPKITTSKCVSVGPSKQSTPTPELYQVTYTDNPALLVPISQAELNTSLAITILQPRLSHQPSKRRSCSQGFQPFHSSHRFPGATPIFLSEKSTINQYKRPRSGASRGQVIKGRARLEGAISKGREVRCFRIAT